MSRLTWRNSLLIGTGIVLVGSFFLPWVTIWGGDQVIQTYSGYTMATRESDAFTRRDFEDYSVLVYRGRPYSPLLFTLPVSALLTSVFTLVVVVHQRGARWARWASLLLATIGPLALVIVLLRIRGAIYHPSLRFQTRYGLWIVGLALLAAWYVAIVGIADRYMLFYRRPGHPTRACS